MRRRNWGMSSLVVAGVAASLVFGGCAAFLSSPDAKSKVWVTVPKAPPAAKAETAPNTTKAGHFWVRGYWDYVPNAGVFQWRKGQFKKVRANRRYVYAKYVQKAGQWRYRIPHWRRAKKRQARPTPQPDAAGGNGPVTTR